MMEPVKTRKSDGSAGDADYGTIGAGYARCRQPEPQIASRIHRALGDAKTVLNAGAGAGSYEPVDRKVTAVEPSVSMRAQRPSSLPAAIDAVAENLPFPDAFFDAAMATFTIHQWSDLQAGLREMRRVTRGPVVILTCDPDEVERFWLNDYAPQVLKTEAGRYPAMARIRDILRGNTDILPVPIPLHCKDGFNEAYYGRPERLLEDGARLACSAWSFIDQAASGACVGHLRRELANGAWDRKYGHLRTQPEYEGSLRLVVSYPTAR
jgi:SAM-dependent methyltransferase